MPCYALLQRRRWPGGRSDVFFTWKATALAAACVLVLAVGWRLHGSIYESGRRACALEYAALADTAARRAREAAEAQSARDLAAAKAQATARLAQLNRRHALDADIARRPAPADCGLDAVSLGLLNDAVRSGNDATRIAASGVPGGVPTCAGTD